MTRRPNTYVNGSNQTTIPSFECPHCGVLQSLDSHSVEFMSVKFFVSQCINCKDIQIDAKLYHQLGQNRFEEFSRRFFPQSEIRQSRLFKYAPTDVMEAYNDSCHLYPIHIGAAGAYVRRALELVLDVAGYKAKTLADSIQLAEKEADADKRLPKRLLGRLNYIKEIGNFALHVRRDDELAIVPIADIEVDACIETLEDLVEFIFESPVVEYIQQRELNVKLVKAGKKPIPLPTLPEGIDETLLDGTDESET